MEPAACPHLTGLRAVPRVTRSVHCDDCAPKGLDLWVCLYKDCTYVGCSESDHSALHYKKNRSHCVQASAANGVIWCFECGDVENLRRRGLKGAGGDEPRVLGLERGPSLNVAGAADSQESSDADDDDDGAGGDSDDAEDPRGLVGLQNIGNTCYMNSAIQALSNTPPLTQFFLHCGASVDYLTDNKKTGLSRTYQKLVREIWHTSKTRKTRGYVVPRGILYGIRNVHPMFRGYHQHDTQEFLRCFMDQLHEELKEPVRQEKPKKTPHPKYGYITRQPLQKNSNAFELDNGRIKILNDSDNEREKGLFHQKSWRSSARSYDNIPWVTSGHHYRMNLQSDEVENGPQSLPGHRRSFSYCDPRAYFQLPYDKKDESPRAGSPMDYIDREHSDKESDDEETYETCDSGGSDTASVNGDDRNASLLRSAKGFKRKSESENASERHQSDGEADSSTSTRFRSIISDVFDGRLLSSVQCLTCDRISTRVETFQDLSLPIPSRDHVAVLHNGASTSGGGLSGSSGGRGAACSDAMYSAASSQEGWVWWILGWLRSWLYGPAVTLHDCLAAFFSADELKGDNMYSCEKCNKLRNGVKFSKVLGLPEVLCVHLKRFRHELMSSTKIGAKVSFPLSGLDMRPYLHKDCTSTVSTYDLVAVICHAGTAGGGHYTCVARNHLTGRWFEFDDQLVTGLTPEQVTAFEAYVLFYKKSNPRMVALRQRAVELSEEIDEMSDVKYYVSKQWINRFNTYAEPGPIDNRDFLCPHGGVPPDREFIAERLTVAVSQPLWEFLFENFGGGPTCSHLHFCMVCRMEAEMLQHRQKTEFQNFTILQQQFSSLSDEEIANSAVYAISMNWFRLWQAFARDQTKTPPPPIDNSGIIKPSKDDNKNNSSGSEYAQLNEDLWRFFFDTYGGGPEIKLRSAAPCVQQQQQQQQDHITKNSNINSSSTISNKSAYSSYQPSHNSLGTPSSSTQHTKRASNYDISHKGSDSDDTYHVEGHAKSLSNVDLFNVSKKHEGGTPKKSPSVKGTQSLQDVSAGQNYTNNVHASPHPMLAKRELKSANASIENRTDSVDYAGKNSLDHCNGDVSVKYNSREMSSDDSEYQASKSKSKKGNLGKKSKRSIEQTKSSLSTESSVPELQPNAQRDDANSVNNMSNSTSSSPKPSSLHHHRLSKENHRKSSTEASSFELPNLESISLKSPQQTSNRPGGKHKKPSRKLKRQQAAAGSGHSGNNKNKANNGGGECTPVVNGGGGEKIAK